MEAIEDWVSAHHTPGSVAADNAALVAELLADRNWHRARIPVTWEDIARLHLPDFPARCVAWIRENLELPETYISMVLEMSTPMLAQTVGYLGTLSDMVALDVLDEITATKPAA